jgi:LCP family protein required for cell wall assembly
MTQKKGNKGLRFFKNEQTEHVEEKIETSEQKSDDNIEKTTGTAERKAKRAKRRKKKIVISLSIIVGLVFLLATGVFALYMIAVSTPPEQTGERLDTDEMSEFYGERYEGVFTFLIFGIDDTRSDTIMTATFDTMKQTLNVVSIPRDTIVNVPWHVKKANSIIATMNQRYRGEENRREMAMDATVAKFADILGYEVDFWVVVEMDALIALVDAIGGVEFYVPVDMRYNDPFARPPLNINFRQGLQHIDGASARELLRFRGFADGDIGRIRSQQSFLMTAIDQIIANIGIRQVPDLVAIFLNQVDTNVSLDNLVWFGREFLRMDAENISFKTAPGNYNDHVNGLSYVSLLVDEWVDMINTYLNPFDEDIVATDLSILTRDANRRFFVTNGVFAGNPSWGMGGDTVAEQAQTDEADNAGAGSAEDNLEATNGESEQAQQAEDGAEPLEPDEGVSEAPQQNEDSQETLQQDQDELETQNTTQPSSGSPYDDLPSHLM